MSKTLWLFGLLLVHTALCTTTTIASHHVDPPSGGNKFGDIIHRVQNFFTFLCTRCEQIIVLADDAIDNQTLKKDADKLCEATFSFNEVIQKVCKTLVEDVLSEIYLQLQRFKPDAAVCAHLHLCDSCGNLTAKSHSFLKIPEDHGAAAKVLRSVAKLQHVIFDLSESP